MSAMDKQYAHQRTIEQIQDMLKDIAHWQKEMNPYFYEEVEVQSATPLLEIMQHVATLYETLEEQFALSHDFEENRRKQAIKTHSNKDQTDIFED